MRGHSRSSTVNLNPSFLRAESIARNILTFRAFFSIARLRRYLPRSMAKNEPNMAPIHTANDPNRIASIDKSRSYTRSSQVQLWVQLQLRSSEEVQAQIILLPGCRQARARRCRELCYFRAKDEPAAYPFDETDKSISDSLEIHNQVDNESDQQTCN